MLSATLHASAVIIVDDGDIDNEVDAVSGSLMKRITLDLDNYNKPVKPMSFGVRRLKTLLELMHCTDWEKSDTIVHFQVQLASSA